VTGYRQPGLCFIVDVSDLGPGLKNWDRIPAMPDPEASSGRGRPLMQELADAVYYRPTERGMCVRLVKTAKGPHK
jgi:anti-sigma regulatory factor (Ser/Thr protein kinase)